MAALAAIAIAATASTAPAAWKRQPCGATTGNADIVTKWGA
eukprot:SAG22_NODE_6318_length_871_cov_0.700777_2_plen_40_part_01